jgi:endonuclease G
VDKAGIPALWIICGPVFENGKPLKVIGPDRVGAPHACYKIIAWKGADGKLTARGYIIGQEATEKDLTTYLTSIDAIEEATGLDFFSDLDDVEEDALEGKRFTTLWGEK